MENGGNGKIEIDGACKDGDCLAPDDMPTLGDQIPDEIRMRKGEDAQRVREAVKVRPIERPQLEKVARDVVKNRR